MVESMGKICTLWCIMSTPERHWKLVRDVLGMFYTERDVDDRRTRQNGRIVGCSYMPFDVGQI